VKEPYDDFLRLRAMSAAADALQRVPKEQQRAATLPVRCLSLLNEGGNNDPKQRPHGTSGVPARLFLELRSGPGSLRLSLYRRHPVGGLVAWASEAKTTVHRGDGPIAAGIVKLILDGQQRMTSLNGVVRGRAPTPRSESAGRPY